MGGKQKSREEKTTPPDRGSHRGLTTTRRDHQRTRTREIKANLPSTFHPYRANNLSGLGFVRARFVGVSGGGRFGRNPTALVKPDNDSAWDSGIKAWFYRSFLLFPANSPIPDKIGVQIQKSGKMVRGRGFEPLTPTVSR